MRTTALLSTLALGLAAVPALADRPVTEAERTKLTAAVKAQGCSGGTKMEFDDGRFEVDDVRCDDGNVYDLKFDKSFKLIKKDLED